MARTKAIETAETDMPTPAQSNKDLTIESALLHAPFLVPGITAEVHLNTAKIPTIRMKRIDWGDLHCTAKQKSGSDISWIVPAANIKSMVIMDSK